MDRPFVAGSGSRGESRGDGGETLSSDDSDPKGTVVLHPEPALGDLFGSLKLERPVASTHEEKQAAREAMARESAGRGSP
jgi:hypothetical protein